MAQPQPAMLTLVSSSGPLQEQALRYLEAAYRSPVGARLHFHSFDQAKTYATRARELAEGCNLDADASDRISVVAAFLGAGYLDWNATGWLESAASARWLRSFLERHQVASREIEEAVQWLERGLALANAESTSGAAPEIFEEILSDTIQGEWARKKIFKRLRLLREESEALSGRLRADSEWYAEMLQKLTVLQFRTPPAREQFERPLERNLRELDERLREVLHLTESSESHEPDPKAVEAFFKIQTRHLMSLISLADRKASVMVHMNAIVLSIGVSFVLGKYKTEAHGVILVPALLLIVTNLVTIWLSVVAIRPSVPDERKLTKEDVMRRHAYLCSQMTFGSISYEDFRLGMRTILQDGSFIYENMMAGLHSNGQILQRKLRLIRWSYQVFLFGLSTSVVLFVGLTIAAF